MKLISDIPIVTFILMLVFVSLFIYQQVFAVSKYINEENTCNLKYTDCWKFLKDTETESDLELANLFHKKVDKFLYPDFNSFHSFQLVPYIQNDGYNQYQMVILSFLYPYILICLVLKTTRCIII